MVDAEDVKSNKKISNEQIINSWHNILIYKACVYKAFVLQYSHLNNLSILIICDMNLGSLENLETTTKAPIST